MKAKASETKRRAKKSTGGAYKFCVCLHSMSNSSYSYNYCCRAVCCRFVRLGFLFLILFGCRSIFFVERREKKRQRVENIIFFCILYFVGEAAKSEAKHKRAPSSRRRAMHAHTAIDIVHTFTQANIHTIVCTYVVCTYSRYN